MNQDADASRFAVVLSALAEVFGEQLSETRMEAYFIALSDLPIDTVEAAIARGIRSCRFFPRPAELRDFAEGGSPPERAELAWVRFNQALREFDARQAVYCEPAAIADTVLQIFGGWPEAYEAWAYLKEPAWQAKRKEFLATFQALAQRRVTAGGKFLPGTWQTAPSLNGAVNRLALTGVGEVRTEPPALSSGEPDAEV